MSDALERVLRLVAEGRLSAEEAEPILAALDGEEPSTAAPEASRGGTRGERTGGRFVRVEVTERGAKTVNLRLPASLGSLGMMGVPGLSGSAFDRVRAALSAGVTGPIVEVADEDGDGVRIVIE